MPRKPSVEERVKKYMTTLNLSYEDALKVVQDDDTIDNGGKCEWEKEMTPEQKRIARKARMADREVKKEKQLQRHRLQNHSLCPKGTERIGQVPFFFWAGTRREYPGT